MSEERVPSHELRARDDRGREGLVTALSWVFMGIPLAFGFWALAQHQESSLRTALVSWTVAAIGAPFFYTPARRRDVVLWQGAGYMTVFAVILGVMWPMRRWPGTDIIVASPAAAFAFMTLLVVIFAFTGYVVVRAIVGAK